MAHAYLLDGRAPVYGPESGRPGGLLHRAVLLRGKSQPTAGCSQPGRLDVDRLVLAVEADRSRMCRRSGCAGSAWHRGRTVDEPG
ncbi:hypothetical protein OG948_59450 (plasmid) [Embleya sp. NBC_00888]|uniref:hypothetical protein n=1 Tax=Embleya sp. NBC_00888 TaxID=2975960 RepID=UPI002F91ACAC|nr:hypothetical protein OG948_59450 [Embleya sp. NBC_00888]